MAEASLQTEHDPRMDYEPPSVARGGAEALLFRIAEAVLQAALLILTARLMEPAGRGLYALASLTAMLCSLPLGPVWSAGAIEVARRRTPLPELFGGLSVIAAIGGTLTALCGCAVAALLGDRWWVVAFPAATAPFILFARYGEGLYQAVGHVRAVNWITIGRVLLPLAFITPSLIAGADARSAIEIWTLWLVALPVLIYFPLRRVVGGRRLPAERGLYRRLVVTGGTLSVANFALIMGPRIALIALAIFADDAAVGVFSVAVAAGDLLYLTTNSLVSSGFRGIASRPRAESIDLATRSIRHALVLALAVGIVLVPAVRILLPIVVGGGYEQVPGLLAILLPGILGLSGFWVLHTFFTVQVGRPRLVSRIAVAAMAANALLCVVLVPLLGSWGAALATTGANLLLAGLSFHWFHRIAGVRLRELRPGRAELRDYVTLLRTLRARS